ncbi:MAG: DNA polymerase III subunit delta [Alphaproteobacteria bacterium]|nr:DNA polymerase III subunit delta [Alphaproteobacteria bacterium]
MNIKPEQVDGILKSLPSNIRGVVIYGSNEGMIATLSQQFIRAVSPDIYDAFHVSYLDMAVVGSDIGALYAEFNAQSLMGGRRVVVIKDATNVLTKPLKELLSSSSSDSLLVITSSSLKTKDSLAVMAKDESDFYGIGCYDDRDEDIVAFASKFMSQNGFKIDNTTFQLLCSRLSNDRKISANELDKLITYMGENKTISIDDVLRVISDTSASSQEDLCYFVALGQTEKAIASFNKLIFEGENPVSLIRTLSYHFMKLLDCAVKIESGETADKVVFGLRPPLMFFRKNAFLSQLRLWNRNRIMNALSLLYQTERECKTTDFPAEQAASFALMRLANGVKRFR